MKINTIEVSGFVSCFNNIRKPHKKECRSELSFDIDTNNDGYSVYINSSVQIHENDLKLLQRLIKNGDEEAKSVRFINVTAEIQAPLFWWSEENTYTVGVTRGCSESTMHTLLKETLDYTDFENGAVLDLENLKEELKFNAVENDIETAKCHLPSSFLQSRDINYNYQTLRRIWKQRQNHKLSQWKVFIDWIETLPLAKELILID